MPNSPDLAISGVSQPIILCGRKFRLLGFLLFPSDCGLFAFAFYSFFMTTGLRPFAPVSSGNQADGFFKIVTSNLSELRVRRSQRAECLIAVAQVLATLGANS